MRVCSIDGCQGKVREHGMCNKHALRLKRNGDPLIVKRVSSYFGMVCKVDGCESKILAKFLCSKHYNRKVNGKPEHLPIKQMEFCSIPSCDEIVKCSHLCAHHYRKTKYHQYRSKDPWRYRAYSHERRALVKNASPWPISIDDIVLRMNAQEGKCWLCGKEASTIDHVKPLSKGGLHILANLRPACLSCNSRKRNRWFGTNRLDELIIS